MGLGVRLALFQLPGQRPQLTPQCFGPGLPLGINNIYDGLLVAATRLHARIGCLVEIGKEPIVVFGCNRVILVTVALSTLQA